MYHKEIKIAYKNIYDSVVFRMTAYIHICIYSCVFWFVRYTLCWICVWYLTQTCIWYYYLRSNKHTCNIFVASYEGHEVGIYCHLTLSILWYKRDITPRLYLIIMQIWSILRYILGISISSYWQYQFHSRIKLKLFLYI